MFHVYVIENMKGTLYVGQTGDIDRRLAEHNDPQSVNSKFTRKHQPWKLVWTEMHPTRAAAMARERQIKSMRSARWIRDHLLSPSSAGPGAPGLTAGS